MQFDLKTTLVHQSTQKSCSRCGRRFGCGANDKTCWCTQMPSLPGDLISADADCLCPECLEARITSGPDDSA